MGNSDVKLKHKVQLRRKVEEPKLVDKESIENTTSSYAPRINKYRLLMWSIIGVVVICFVGYFIFSKSGNEGKTSVVVAENTEVKDFIVPSDTVYSSATVDEKAGDTELELVENNNSDINESATSVESARPDDATIKLSTSASVESVDVSNDVETEAMKVIRGDYGIGQERKNKLGAKYQTIQNRVNELKREGVF